MDTFGIVIDFINGSVSLVAVGLGLHLAFRLKFRFQRRATIMLLVAMFVFCAGEVVSVSGQLLHWWPVDRIINQVAETAAMICVIVAFYLSARSERLEIAVVRELSERDALTRLHNMAYFEKVGRQKLSGARSYDRPLTLLMIDVDDFKQYNDTYGHEAGNAALNAVAQTLRSTSRSDDMLARYGGEEFVVLVPGNRNAAIRAAERIRSNIRERCRPEHSAQLKRGVTVSIGVGILAPDMKTLDELIEAADKAMYRAKASGKNCVICTETDQQTGISRENAKTRAAKRKRKQQSD